MKPFILVGQILSAALLTACILIQSQGSGLGKSTTWMGKSYHSKRGAEKIIFGATIVLAILFLLLSIVNVI